MNSNTKILIVLIIVIIFPIIINEIYTTEKRILINDANKILKLINNEKNEFKEIIINNSFKINDKEYKVKGEGVIFLDDDTFFLGTEDKCIMKLNYSEKIMYQDEPCPVYRMFNGIKNKIVTSGDGLYQENDRFYFKGKDVYNYVLYEEKIWNIVEFNNDGMKLINKRNIEDSDEYETLVISKDVYIKKGTGSIKDPYIID